MTLSAAKERALLGIKPYCDKLTVQPRLRVYSRSKINSVNNLQEDPPDKLILPQNPSSRKTLRTAQLTVSVITVSDTKNTRICGLTEDVRRSKLPENCTATANGNYVTAKRFPCLFEFRIRRAPIHITERRTTQYYSR